MVHANQYDAFSLRDDAPCGHAHDGVDLVR